MSTSRPGFAFDNTFANELEGLFVPSKAAGFAAPALVELNIPLARELGLDPEALAADAAQVFSGNTIPEGASPLAQAYAGHQFGGFSAQLGDGRALLLGELIDVHGRRRDLQLKGSGPTTFSRGGDGKAALGPVLREYLVGEAMHGLGIPTTRALAAVVTGESVYRERALPGAVLARVASSHIRVGTFEFFAARDDRERLKKLADYTIARHYPEHTTADNPYLELLLAVGKAQAELVAQWMHVGFVHGVMNTDNVTVSGETIDYGPCAFMDAYDLETVFSSIDRQGRYAYGNQPSIAKWNVARFAEALLPLLADEPKAAVPLAHDALEAFTDHYQGAWLRGMRHKLGLGTAEEGDLRIAEQLLSIMGAQRADYTSVFRALSDVARGHTTPAVALFADPNEFEAWVVRWRARLGRESTTHEAIAAAMDRVNPLYIPRNHKTEAALTAAVEQDDLAPFRALLEVISSPFEARASRSDYTTPAPSDFGPYRTFCGT